MDKEKIKIKFITKLPSKHIYYPKLNNIIGNLDSVYTNPQKPKKIMLKFPHPDDKTKDAFLSVKHIEILHASYKDVQLYTIEQLMEFIVDSNIRLPVRLIVINPFRDEHFKIVTLLYISDKDKMAFFSGENKQICKPLSHLKNHLFLITKTQEA